MKRIALAGYDSEYFLAPDDAYAKLDDCCRYARVLKPERVATKDGAMSASNHEKMNHSEMKMDKGDHSNMKMENHSTMKMDDGKNMSMKPEKADFNQLIVVFDNYFAVKDALVRTDEAMASTKSTELLNAIDAVKWKNYQWMFIMFG